MSSGAVMQGSIWFAGGILGLMMMFMVLGLVVAVLVAVWVYRDAEARGMDGIIWLLVVIFTNILGLIIYLIIRTDHPKRPHAASGRTAPCPTCGTSVPVGARSCSNCGQGLAWS